MAADFSPDLSYARRRDAQDPLASFRGRFWIPEDTIYMDGNSLGLCPRDGEASLLELLDQWKKMGINGWLDAPIPWFYLPEHLGARMAHDRPDSISHCGLVTVDGTSAADGLFSTVGASTETPGGIFDEFTAPRAGRRCIAVMVPAVDPGHGLHRPQFPFYPAVL